MNDSMMLFRPSRPLLPGSERWGVLSGFAPGTRTLKSGFQLAPHFKPLPVDIQLDKDIAVTLRDGVVIYVDVYRPVGADKVPVIVAWSPYGKAEGSAPAARGVFDLVGLDDGIVSGLHKFEGPDPAFWCAQGYAICNPDMRGVGESGGDSVLWDRQEGRDGYDLIEWLGTQDWCNGKVAMSGTSYLAASQWFVAAERPPHLAAINPWEGVSDTYRDLCLRGGMPDSGFARMLQEGSYWGKGRQEDIMAEIERYPLINQLWKDKSARLDNITAPAYVVASYSNSLHTLGTFRGWRRIASEHKWLRIHNSQEWPDYYDETNRDDLRKFFDHFLKEEDNGWETTPRVRYAVLDLEGGDRINVAADQFPPASATSTKHYLDATSRSLLLDAPTTDGSVRYDTQAAPAWASFLLRFEQHTELVGYPKAHLWVEAEGADDMDLFVFVQKLNEHGTPLQAFTIPNQSARIHDVTDNGASILCYKGAQGRLRASLRHLDRQRTTHDIPAHTFDRVDKLTPGDIVDVEIELTPIGLSFYPGEQLRLIVSARNVFGPWMPGMSEYIPRNSGHHVIHTGGVHASYLQLPQVTR
ncbi:hydrolase [Mycobacterium sp. E2462]|uniref:CocE/NonD family hydrolase n=1 Tax=Mycobacterium sp. E2462 TaxID=1834133 RepID=UPI0007FFB9BB|nr:CocE/NonD family hydrolase [Mycobacterium sp. E2462]OBI10292.1 hydrolase [Mycobacterium sp. E2462]